MTVGRTNWLDFPPSPPAFPDTSALGKCGVSGHTHSASQRRGARRTNANPFWMSSACLCLASGRVSWKGREGRLRLWSAGQGGSKLRGQHRFVCSLMSPSGLVGSAVSKAPACSCAGQTPRIPRHRQPCPPAARPCPPPARRLAGRAAGRPAGVSVTAPPGSRSGRLRHRRGLPLRTGWAAARPGGSGAPRRRSLAARTAVPPPCRSVRAERSRRPPERGGESTRRRRRARLAPPRPAVRPARQLGAGSSSFRSASGSGSPAERRRRRPRVGALGGRSRSRAARRRARPWRCGAKAGRAVGRCWCPWDGVLRCPRRRSLNRGDARAGGKHAVPHRQLSEQLAACGTWAVAWVHVFAFAGDSLALCSL